MDFRANSFSWDSHDLSLAFFQKAAKISPLYPKKCLKIKAQKSPSTLPYSTLSMWHLINPKWKIEKLCFLAALSFKIQDNADLQKFKKNQEFLSFQNF